MRFGTIAGKAFLALSKEAQLFVALEEKCTEEETLLHYLKYATFALTNKESVGDQKKKNLATVLHQIEFLLDKGVNPDVASQGKTALLMVLKCPELVKLLLIKGANPNASSQFLFTPLHWIASFANSENSLISAELLASKGADLEIKNDQGKHALDLLNREVSFSFKNKFEKVTKNPRPFDEIPVLPLEKNQDLESAEWTLTKEDELDIELYKKASTIMTSLSFFGKDTLILKHENRVLEINKVYARYCYENTKEEVNFHSDNYGPVMSI
jgi:hypothetical protein